MYILALLKKIKHTTVIIVHNFKDAEEIDDLESMVDCDIKGFNLLYRPDAFGGILFIFKSILYLLHHSTSPDCDLTRCIQCLRALPDCTVEGKR